jgi:maleylacetate reductase
LIPIIAIPTTYAGSEMTAVYGITHTRKSPPRKVTVNEPKIAPRLVIYDPGLTLDLPQEMTASTGINALAHCIEALYSVKRNPLSTAAATSAVRHISNALLRCYQDGNNLEARTETLVGAHLAGLALASVAMGLHHGLCHVLGGTANVPHGMANSIILPHAIRFNADATAHELLPAAEAMGISINATSPMVAVEALAQKIFELVGQMNLPQRLRDAGVRESDLHHLAQLAFQNRTVQNNPKPITEPAQIEALLRTAW